MTSLLGKAIQERAKEAKAYQVMSNKAAVPPKEAPKLENHQADRLRLQEVRFLGRAQAACWPNGTRRSKSLPK